MSRKVEEWIGKTDNSPIPDRVKLRIYERANGRCQKCSRKLYPGQWDCDHIIALVNGGTHRESNLQALCCEPCHSGKTREDVKIKAVTYKKKKAYLGIRKKSRFAGSRDSPWRKKINGQVVKR